MLENKAIFFKYKSVISIMFREIIEQPSISIFVYDLFLIILKIYFSTQYTV